jgi:hypothetical protein
MVKLAKFNVLIILIWLTLMIIILLNNNFLNGIYIEPSLEPKELEGIHKKILSKKQNQRINSQLFHSQ